MCRLTALSLAAVAIATFAGSASAQTLDTHCQALTSLTLDHARVVSATVNAPGQPIAISMDYMKISEKALAALPAFCRVSIEDHPSSDSDIKTEVWLPLSGWNGNLRGQGNGGFAGAIYYPQMAAAVTQGYATVGTDTGHAEVTSTFALGHPEKIKDFGWRAIHDMTVQARQIVSAFYGKPAQHAYFIGCSDGGREALMEAQRFPADYDGILAGAPAYNWTGLLSAGSVIESHLHSSAAANIPASKLSVIGNAVRAACDANDGVKDGILNDPRKCGFDPASLLCKSGDADSCLTSEQVASLKVIYSPKVDAKGKQVYPGYLPGAEDADNSWSQWVLGDHALMLFFSSGFFSDFVYQQPGWQVQSFNLDRDYPLSFAKTSEALDASDTNLQPFLAHGGRLILYHGFNDPAIPALGTIDYFNGMTSKVGSAAAGKGTRLYMVPGMLHCSSGPGASYLGQDEDNAVSLDPQHNLITALQQWVEKGTAPAALMATKFTADDPTKPVVFTRPVCPYPALPRYVKGDSNDAKSFVCAMPKK